VGVFPQDGILFDHTQHSVLGRLHVGSNKQEILVSSRMDAATRIIAAGGNLIREVRSHALTITPARIMQGVADVLVVSQLI